MPPLLYADTLSNPDQRYFSQVDVHDPFIAFGVGPRRISVQNALEFGRIKKARTFDEVLSLETWRARAEQRWPRRQIGVAEIITELARAYRIRAFRVADDFPAALFLKLRALGVRLELANGPLFPEREIKSPREAAAIREGNRLCAVGFTVTEKILRAAKPRGRQLFYAGQPLTSEQLRFEIESAMMAEGGQANGTTIVAGGDQACDPHERGTGPLRPHELIIVDIFPRVTRTGYFGDMTRTYLRGRPSEAQRRLVAAVRDAQLAALKVVRAGVDGRAVHQTVVDSFTSAGFETRRTPHGSVGFFHGTGHGLGLAVHEPPRMGGLVSMPLKKGAVVTVEPGLYYPGLGGCRIEDVVQVTERAPRMLSSHPYDWEFR
ncbi:M24 family metallopeptidase [Opitutus terrae]|uniref:M24 family metallopeptidase n=1 Tax=Opitutus terrae TaxID=107709 RepID=UPI001ED8DD0B|nr:Xaa-Pro peptidase family protein [Opitutus terrae]